MFHFTYIKLFVYILTGFIGFMNIVFLFFLGKYKRSGNKKLYIATRNFSLSALFLAVLYGVFLFTRFVFGELESNALFRVVDVLSFICLKYFWLNIVLGILADVKAPKIKRAIDFIFLIFALLCIFNFSMLMDSRYYVANENIRAYVICVNVLLSTVPLVINLYIIIRYYHNMINQTDKIFVIFNSMFINAIACWNGMMAIGLYSGRIFLSEWNTPITDPTSFFLLFTNLSILIFIYKTDFSPIFKATETKAVDTVAVKHLLTEREREVAMLVYKGYTNPDIAEQLFISKNTVRNHIHNIFYKLDISSRMELVHLVNSQNSTGEPLKTK